MELNLTGKVAIVTGGNRGLGAASAAALAAEGANLVLTARDRALLQETAERIEADFSVNVEAVAADLTGDGAADKVVQAALDRFGAIDILINCAGASQGGVFWEIPDQVWNDSFALKFMGTIGMMRAVLPHMRAQGRGRIITIVGNTGKQPPPRMLPGAAANAALLAVTAGLAQEVAGDGIVVLAVNPGPTRTERWNNLMKRFADQQKTTVEQVEQGFMGDIPMNRLGAPEEISRIVAFLVSDAAANMTGTSVTADGGWCKALA